MTDLYRHFDVDGNLLYVGISYSAFQRSKDHLRHSHWSEEIRTITIEKFDTREDALNAERISIDTHAPKYNIVNNKSRYEKKPLRTDTTLPLHKVAEYIGIKRRTLYNMLEDGRFPVASIPGVLPRRWNIDDLDAWRSGTYQPPKREV